MTDALDSASPSDVELSDEQLRYSVHIREEGECDECGNSTPYLVRSSRQVIADLGHPVFVSAWICEQCIDTYSANAFLCDELIMFLEGPADPQFTELSE